MKLFNTDGAAIFGPGSEWLWFMAQFAALAITGIAIYRQLRAQRFANELSIRKSLDDEWLSEHMTHVRVAAMIDVARGRRELTGAMKQVGGLINEIAYQTNHGAFQSTFYWDLGGSVVQNWWWGMAAGRIAKAREVDPTLWREWEQLALAMRERDRRAGVVRNLSPEYLNGPILHQMIVEQIESLRLEREMRSGVIPTWPIPEVASENE